MLSSFPPTASHVARSRCTGSRACRGSPTSATRGRGATEHGYVWARRTGAASPQRSGAVLRHASALTTIGPSLGAELAEHAAARSSCCRTASPSSPSHAVPRTRRSSGSSSCTPARANEPFADLTPVVRALLRLHEQGMPARLTLFGPVDHRTPELDRARGARARARRRATSRARRRSAPPPPRTSPCSCEAPVEDLGHDEALGLPRVAHADPRRREPRVRRGEDRARDAQRLDGAV